MPKQNIDQKNLYDLAFKDSIAAISDVIVNYPDENIYVFALCADSDVGSVFFAANSIEGLNRIHPEIDENRMGYKWSPHEWDLRLAIEDEFSETNALLYSASCLSDSYIEESDNQFLKRKQNTLITLNKALRDATNNVCTKKNTIVSIVSFGDAEEYELKMMIKASKKYNSGRQFREFKEFWK